MREFELSGLPLGGRIELREAGDGGLVFFGTEHFSRGRYRGLRFDGVDRVMSLQRYEAFWIKPVIGNRLAHANAEVLYYLCRLTDGTYGVMLPLCAGNVRSWLQCGEKAGEVELCVPHTQFEADEPQPLLYWQTGTDPYELTESAMRWLSGRLGTFRMRADKKVPEFTDLFGWCTWDAFYREVSSEKVVAGLQAFKEAGLVPPFLILDDGWQQTKDRMLECQFPNEQFPGGLAPLVKTAKQEYGIRQFGIWHAMQGYWCGLHPEGELSREYRIREVNQPRVYRIPGEPGETDPFFRGLIDQEDVGRFYADFYRYLNEEGVDVVKVDNQGGLEDFVPDRTESLGYVNAFQSALQSTAEKEFNGRTIHCMSQSSDVFYALSHGQIVRNSQDYFPAKDELHGTHIHSNGMNNLWTSTVCLPDWDMFHSNHFTAEFHAAARAISGGPIYISDVPADVNMDVIRKLCTAEGRNLRCDQPALPAEDCLFTDCLVDEKLFKITNRHRGTGILGLFNCRELETEAIADSYSVSDVPGMAEGTYVAYFHKAGDLLVVEQGQRLDMILKPLDYELVTFAPLREGIAPIGLEQKFNSSWVFDEIHDSSFRLRAGGELLFYADARPERVTMDEQDVTFSYEDHRLKMVLPDDVSGLLRIHQAG